MGKVLEIEQNFLLYQQALEILQADLHIFRCVRYSEDPIKDGAPLTYYCVEEGYPEDASKWNALSGLRPPAKCCECIDFGIPKSVLEEISFV